MNKCMLWTTLAAFLSGLGTATTQADTNRMDALEARISELESRSSVGGTPLNAHWQNGIRLQSEDGSVRLRIGGRVQSDFAGIDADATLEEDVGEFDSGTKFRRARLYVDGVLYEHGIFRVEYDFAGGDTDLRDALIGIRNVPFLGTIRIGRLLEYYSIEALSGNNYHQFMERGLSAAFNEFWNNGIGIQNQWGDGRGTWSVGASKRTDSFGTSDSNSQHTISARLTAAPIYRDDGRTWVHLGAATIQRKPDNDIYRIRSRPESSVARSIVDTGPIPSDRVQLVGLEFAATHGPASLQAEWHNARVDLLQTDEFAGSGDLDLNGFYVYASYFLTGEHRRYSRSSGTFVRTIPLRNFREDGQGWGAWEIAARYSELDLDDGPVTGGHLRDITLGVNWYINPNMRMMFNYVHADVKDSGEADIVQMRVQFDF